MHLGDTFSSTSIGWSTSESGEGSLQLYPTIDCKPAQDGKELIVWPFLERLSLGKALETLWRQTEGAKHSPTVSVL